MENITLISTIILVYPLDTLCRTVGHNTKNKMTLLLRFVNIRSHTENKV